MGINGYVSIRVDGVELPEVCLEFGMALPKQRRRPIKQGWGMSIELPAVTDLLQAVEDGKITAAQAKELLLRIPSTVYESWKLREQENPADLYAWCRRDGGCPDCERTRPSFGEALTRWEKRFDRFQQPELYPFAVGRSSGLHESICPVPRRDLPEVWERPVAGAFERVLRAYAHTDDHLHHFDPEEVDQEAGRALREVTITWEPMTAAETRAWQAGHTGPQGGRRYHACRRCSATP